MKNKLFTELAEIAPSCAFSAHRELDSYFSWDGDGPDPRNEGFSPYDVYVTAKAIVKGRIVEGIASLGASYYKPDEPLGDVHGYLPQMLEEAATELLSLCPATGTPLPIQAELANAISFVKAEMKRRYDAQGKAGAQ